MIQPSQREKLLIIATGAVLFFVISWIIWKPWFSAWHSASVLANDGRQQLAEVRDMLARKPEIQRQYNDLVKGMTNPGGPSTVPDVGAKLEQLARQAGATLRSRVPEPAKESGGYSEVGVNCVMDASIDSLVRFLCDVKDSPDLLDVTDLKVTPSPANAAILRAELRLVALRVTGR